MSGKTGFRIKGIHHVALVVPDIQAARRFYADTLGFVVVDEDHFTPSPAIEALTELEAPECHMLMLRAPNLFLEIFEFISPEAEAATAQLNRPGFTHLALEVNDIDEAHTRLAEQGVRWHVPPQEIAPGYRMCYGRDPFGNVLELQATTLESSAPFSHLPAMD